MKKSIRFVGLDVHKNGISVAVAENDSEKKATREVCLDDEKND